MTPSEVQLTTLTETSPTGPGVWLALLLTLIALPTTAEGPPSQPAPPAGVRNSEYAEAAPTVERISEHEARIGRVLVDRRAHRLEVPGKVIRLDPPLEFLAIKRNGDKGYESLIELDATAVEFNTACILIGLTQNQATHPAFQSEKSPVGGDRVGVRVRWQVDGKDQEVEASRLLRLEGQPVEAPEWVYTGSVFLPDRRYLAALDGTLIGFVHSPASIIEHRTGLGLGHWGAVGGDPAVCPPVGTPVVLTVQVESVPVPDPVQR
jgi:hypothetical protein